jgi:hypothetical protein
MIWIEVSIILGRLMKLNTRRTYLANWTYTLPYGKRLDRP